MGARGLPQGSKGQEGELFGIQNLLKFSDDSLLKALRMKHEAALAASGAGGTVAAAGAARAGGGGSTGGGSTGGGSGNSLGVAGVDTADEAELMVAMKVALDRAEEMEDGEGSRRRRKFLFVGAKDRKRYMPSELHNIAAGGQHALQEVCSATFHPLLPLCCFVRTFYAFCSLTAGGADGPPEDSELAGLLGVLGVDAYTHDQLVAKDEGEEVLLLLSIHTYLRKIY